MVDIVQDLTILHHGEENSKSHFYVWCGICDLTERLRGEQYEEVIFDNESFKLKKPSLYREVDDLASNIEEQYAVPIFCTIFPLSLSDWNTHRLAYCKTNSLNFIDQYPQMQIDLAREVKEFNDYLTHSNMNRGLATPMIHRDFLHNRGRGRVVQRYGDLLDGCHPNDELTNRCKNSLMLAYSKNKNKLRY